MIIVILNDGNHQALINEINQDLLSKASQVVNVTIESMVNEQAFSKLYGFLKQADSIILTPEWIEIFRSNFQKLSLYGKVILFIDQIDHQLINDMGLVSTGVIKDKVNANTLMNFHFWTYSKRKDYSPSFKQVMDFNKMKIKAYQSNDQDWLDFDLLDKDYYYDCKLSVLKASIGNLYYLINKNRG